MAEYFWDAHVINMSMSGGAERPAVMLVNMGGPPIRLYRAEFGGVLFLAGTGTRGYVRLMFNTDPISQFSKLYTTQATWENISAVPRDPSAPYDPRFRVAWTTGGGTFAVAPGSVVLRSNIACSSLVTPSTSVRWSSSEYGGFPGLRLQFSGGDASAGPIVLRGFSGVYFAHGTGSDNAGAGFTFSQEI